jgi:alpha-1,6-mannosyltransferase
LRVDFLGHVADPGAVAGELAAADVALAPCPAESFGLAALEALACGTPVVASRRGAAPELIGPGAGLAVADGPRAVARGVVQLMQRPRTERETAARRSAERFPWERTVTGMLAVHRAAGARVG